MKLGRKITLVWRHNRSTELAPHWSPSSQKWVTCLVHSPPIGPGIAVASTHARDSPLTLFRVFVAMVVELSDTINVLIAAFVFFGGRLQTMPLPNYKMPH